jgi:hypothetical protein
MKLKIAILETAMLVGICGSAFLLPRSFPLSWFIAISLGVFATANIVLFNLARSDRSTTGYRMGPRAYLGFGLIIFYWILCFLRR